MPADPSRSVAPSVAEQVRRLPARPGPVLLRAGETPALLAQRLRGTRERVFAGRETQLDLFRSALAAQDRSTVLFVHGSPGIGKSALLRRFADLAADAGRGVIEVDGRSVASGDRLAARAEAAAAGDRPVLLVDSFDRCQGLEPWVAGTFLPGLPAGGLVVLAGRRPPDPGAWSDPGWHGVLRVTSLGNLSVPQSAALLRGLGVPEHLREPVLAFAAGHPLALRLAAEAATDEATGAQVPGARGWTPSPAVVDRLLTQLVGPVPSALHRRALEVCAHVMATTEDLLRAVLPQDADEMFDWLRRQPFIEAGRHGLRLCDPVRELVHADLAWRDPQALQDLGDRVRERLAARAIEASGADVLPAVAALAYPHRRHRVRGMATWRGETPSSEDVLRPSDTEAVLELAEKAEGPESAAVVDFWLRRQPEAFRVHRDAGDGGPLAFVAWLRLERADEEEIAADPVVAAAWTHSRATRPVRGGEHLGIGRFWVDPAGYQRPSAVGDLMQLRFVAEWIRSRNLAWSYTVLADAAFWEPLMTYLDQRPVPAVPEVGGRQYHLFAHDWRVVPRDAWLQRGAVMLRSGPAASPAQTRLTVLSRPEFDAAVREALRCRHDRVTLSANPLTGSRLVRDRGPGDPAALLRDAVGEALDSLRDDPRHSRLHLVLTTTFSQRGPTQQAAARALHLPFSTYRRHLATATAAVCDVLWQEELHGPVRRTADG